MKMKKCIKCGREIPADYGFCKYCGAKQPVGKTVSPVSDSSQDLKTAKSEAGMAKDKATSTSTSAKRDALEEPNPSGNLDKADVSEASQKASKAENEASQAEDRVKRLSASSQSQSRRAQATRKTDPASTEFDERQARIDKEAERREQAEKAKKAREKERIKQSPTHRKHVAIGQEVLAFLLPFIGLVFVASITGGEGIGTLIGVAIFAIIGVFFSVKQIDNFKKTSISAIVWAIIILLVALLSMLG